MARDHEGCVGVPAGFDPAPVAAQVLEEIRRDAADGVYARIAERGETLNEFSVLHECVDANMYVLDLLDRVEEDHCMWCTFDAVADIVDAALWSNPIWLPVVECDWVE